MPRREGGKLKLTDAFIAFSDLKVAFPLQPANFVSVSAEPIQRRVIVTVTCHAYPVVRELGVRS